MLSSPVVMLSDPSPRNSMGGGRTLAEVEAGYHFGVVTPRGGSRYMPLSGSQHLKRSGSLARQLSGVGRDLLIDALEPTAAPDLSLIHI